MNEHLESITEHGPSEVVDDRQSAIAGRGESYDSDEEAANLEEKSINDSEDRAEGNNREREQVAPGEAESEVSQAQSQAEQELEIHGARLGFEDEKEPPRADQLEQPSEHADMESQITPDASNSSQVGKSDTDSSATIVRELQSDDETRVEPPELGEARDVANVSKSDQQSAPFESPTEEQSETVLQSSGQLPTEIEQERLSNETQQQDVDRNPVVIPGADATRLGEERASRIFEVQDADALWSEGRRGSQGHELANLQEPSHEPDIFEERPTAQPNDGIRPDGTQNVATSREHENTQPARETSESYLDRQALGQTSSRLIQVTDSSEAPHINLEASRAEEAISVDSRHGDARAAGGVEAFRQSELASFERHDRSVTRINNHPDTKEATFKVDARSGEHHSSTSRTEWRSTKTNQSSPSEHRDNLKFARLSANEGAPDGAPNAGRRDTGADNLAKRGMTEPIEKRNEAATSDRRASDRVEDRSRVNESVAKANHPTLPVDQLSEREMVASSQARLGTHVAARNDGQNEPRLASVRATACLATAQRHVHFGVVLRTVEKQIGTKLERGKLYEIKGRIDGLHDFRTLHKAGE
jgi:hypothetical protein